MLIEPPSRSVCGYYTLSVSAVDAGKLRAEMIKKLPRSPQLLVTMLGRLAVSRELRGKGLGEALLLDALHCSLDAAAQIAAVAVFVDAKDESAKAFYKYFGLIA